MAAQIDSFYFRTSLHKTFTRLLSYAFFEGRPLTTKGQWINPILFFLFSIQKRIPQISQVDKPVFIVGTGRSGTTILGTILSMHQDVGYLNEPKALWHSIYPYEDLTGSYSSAEAEYRLSSEHAAKQTIVIANRLYGFYLRVVGAKRVVDKYPELIFRIPFVKTLFPDAKFIFLIRNAWDTCQSIEKWSQDKGTKSQAELHDWWGRNNRKWNLLWEQLIETDKNFFQSLPPRQELETPLNMAALEWILAMREGLRMSVKYPDDIKTIRYEDLVQHPHECLSDLLNYCGLSQDNRCLNYASKTLKVYPSKQAFDIHPALSPYMEETMTMLGYSL